MAPRLPTNQEDREVYLREHDAARYVEMIGDASARSVDNVLMTINAFAGEPDVLYVALDYAYHEGMKITMAPPTPRDEPGS